MSTKKNYPKYKSICRLDYPHKYMFGWLVRVTFKGQTVRRYFMDSQYDSPEEALEAALEFRNETERQMGKLRSERIVTSPGRRNRTGVAGVCRRRKRTRHDRGNIIDFYEVAWHPEPGKIKRAFISIQKYGEEEAFRLACELRKAKELQYLAEPSSKN